MRLNYISTYLSRSDSGAFRMYGRTLFFILAFAATAVGQTSTSDHAAPWIPDRGDGTFQNPVLHADYSDPDAIRVGDDFWLTSSSFGHVPGLPILHSRDLVNWELVNHALPRLVPDEHFQRVRHGEGVWAPAIRHHGGKFWIYYPDPDFGLYVVTATDPRGQWSAPALVKAGKGLIDPCPFWDDDGQLYLVHGWARSRGPISNRLSLTKLSSEGLRTLDESKDIVDGNKLDGWRTIEGPKLYKRKGYYYIFAPAGGVKEGYQAVFRAKNIYGPYETRVVLEQGSSPVNGPHQGAWVDTPAGENWFLHFQDQGAYGRVVHLQPMTWRDDDWPAMGTAAATKGEKGEPVLTFKKPNLPARPIAVPTTSDEFDDETLGLQWQWQANPEPAWFSLSARRGALRLFAYAPPKAPSLYDAPNLTLQKFPAPHFTVTAALDGEKLRAGEEAGLVVFGFSYAWIGLRRDAHGMRIVQALDREHSQVHSPGTTRKPSELTQPLATPRVLLRVEVQAGAKCRFSYSTDEKNFSSLEGAPEFDAEVDRWVGAKVGVFAARTTAAGATDTVRGYVDVDWFHVSK